MVVSLLSRLKCFTLKKGRGPCLAPSKAQRELLLAAWMRLASAKSIHDLSQREEYQFWREEFAHGLSCRYDGDEQELVRVFSDSSGIKIDINKELAATIPASESILGVLVRAMSESFATTYCKAKGILPLEAGRTEELEIRRSQSS